MAYAEWSFTIDTIAPAVVHQPVTEGIVGTEISIEARVTDASGLSDVYLYYRTVGDGQFNQVSMTQVPSTDVYTATIPASMATVSGVEYYVEATDTVGNIGGSPATNRASQPHRVLITEVQQQSSWVVYLVVGVAIIVSAILAVLILIRMRRSTKKEPQEGPDKNEEEPDNQE